jgi:hypothetical protein
MKANPALVGSAVVALLGSAACDRLALGPETAASAPSAPSVAPVDPHLRSHAGETYAVFSAAAANYAPDALGLSAGDRARVWRAMAVGQAGQIMTGGGAEALVFSGCAEAGCADGKAVVAVDLATGDAFVGVRDVGGADVLEPNDRLDALLRLNSPTRAWDDPRPSPEATPPPVQP